MRRKILPHAFLAAEEKIVAAGGEIVGAAAKPANVGVAAWQLAQRATTIAWTSANVASPAAVPAPRGIRATNTAASSAIPIAQNDGFTMPRWRNVKNSRMNTPASAIAISTSQFHFAFVNSA